MQVGEWRVPRIAPSLRCQPPCSQPLKLAEAEMAFFQSCSVQTSASLLCFPRNYPCGWFSGVLWRKAI
jgi:hypothetical protein